MKIAILARNSNLYSHQRLIQAGTARGHEIRVINPKLCYMRISGAQPEIHCNGQVIDNINAIIPRIGASITFYGTAVVRQFELMGVYTLNSSIAIARSRDKLRSLQLLARKKIPIPITGFANSPDNTDDLVQMVGDAPLIIKLVEGTQGKGVVLAETKAVAKSVISALKQLDANILVQEFIKEAAGCDIRCFVIGEQVVGAFLRCAAEGDFRSNLHQGGNIRPVELTLKERKMAIDAVKIMGLNLAGVDLIRAKHGSLVLEVNSSPGFKGFETATQVDVASEIIKFIEIQLASHTPDAKLTA